MGQRCVQLYMQDARSPHAPRAGADKHMRTCTRTCTDIHTYTHTHSAPTHYLPCTHSGPTHHAHAPIPVPLSPYAPLLPQLHSPPPPHLVPCVHSRRNVHLHWLCGQRSGHGHSQAPLGATHRLLQ